MENLEIWLNLLKTALQLSSGAMLGAGLFAVLYIAISFLLSGIFPLDFPLFVVTGIGLILGEAFNQTIKQLKNSPNRRYLEQEKLVISKLKTLDEAEKLGFISSADKKVIGGELIKNLTTGQSIETLDSDILLNQDSTPKLEDDREEG